MDRAHAAHGQQLPLTSCPDMGTRKGNIREEDLKKRGEGANGNGFQNGNGFLLG